LAQRAGTLVAVVICAAASVLGLLTVALGGFTSLGGSTAVAQSLPTNSLVDSEPADGSTLPTSPAELTFTFAERLGNDDTLTAPVACGSVPQRLGVPEVSADRVTVTVAVLSPFPRGACTISWGLRDGLNQQVAGGIITFSVTSSPVSESTAAPTGGGTGTNTVPSAATGTEDEDSSGGVEGALWFGRVVSTTAILALFGAIALIGLAWPEGPEYVLTRRYLQSLWLLALFGTMIFVVSRVAIATSTPFGSALNPVSWLELAESDWTDRFALVRLFLVVASVWAIWRPERLIDPATQLVAVSIPALAVIMVGLSRIGGSLAPVGIVLSITHAAAAAVWFGGALIITRVVASGAGDSDLVDAIRAFNKVSMPAILVTIVTGVAQMIRLDGGQLFTSGHGQVLLVKTVAVAAMVFLAIATRQVVAARMRRARGLTVGLAARFRRAFGVEAVVGVIVLAMSGWLVGLTPPSEVTQITYAVERQFVDRGSELDVRVLIRPAAVGPNGIRVVVSAPATGISDLRLVFIPPEGTDARIIEQAIPLSGIGVALLDQADGLPFDVAGLWTLQLSGITRAGTLSEASTTFTVADPTPDPAG
jgi:putative copper export protein/methionine-rich copper-binding protein CopC